MKRLLLPLCLLFSLTCWTQQFSAKDLIDFTEYQLSKFDGYIIKKDFKRDYNSLKESQTVTGYFKPGTSKDSSLRQIYFEQVGNKTTLYYYTSNLDESGDLKRQFTRLKFKYYPGESGKGFYEKGDVYIRSVSDSRDSIVLYGFQVVKTILPKAKDILFAEDLLELRSHEFIVMVYGEQNVIKDQFYYTPTEKANCSVLFPNSNREVIFLWKDEVKYRDLVYLLCGNNFKTNSSANFNKLLIQNVWRSKQGLFCGMSLQELQEVNQYKISFYDWNSERAGMLTKENSGAINFDNVSVILGCLNCMGAESNNYIVHSDELINNSRKIYVSSLIIIPGKDEATTTSRN